MEAWERFAWRFWGESDDGFIEGKTLAHISPIPLKVSRAA